MLLVIELIRIKGNALAIDSVNNLYVSGYIGCSGCIFGDSLLPNSYNDAFLVKYDSFGDMKWIDLIGQYHGDYDGNENSGNSIVIDCNGNIILTGYFDGINSNGTIITGNNLDFLVMKVNQNGTIINIGKYGYTTWDVGESTAVDSKNNIYFTGYTYKGAESTEYPSYIFIAKVDSIFPLGIENKKISENISIFPNPTYGRFTINLPPDYDQAAAIIVNSIEGKTIYKTVITEKHKEIVLTGCKPNIYIIKIQIKDNVYYKKLMIE